LPHCDRSPVGASSALGYTLIEVLAAFTLLAIGLGILLSILSSGVHAISRASESTRASLYAESLFDTLGADKRLRAGRSQGAFENGRFRWTIDVEPFPTPAPAAGPGGIGVPQEGVAENALFHVVLQMQWNGGGSGRVLRVDTLRAYAPPQDLSQ
jgi:general secretion pathway protein I